uniref:Uncharacterized protein n=1 Tax=Anguilla anguilla TaxID=7936 RepID=A0A0E9XZ69_ANGAN
MSYLLIQVYCVSTIGNSLKNDSPV